MGIMDIDHFDGLERQINTQLSDYYEFWTPFETIECIFYKDTDDSDKNCVVWMWESTNWLWQSTLALFGRVFAWYDIPSSTPHTPYDEDVIMNIDSSVNWTHDDCYYQAFKEAVEMTKKMRSYPI